MEGLGQPLNKRGRKPRQCSGDSTRSETDSTSHAENEQFASNPTCRRNEGKKRSERIPSGGTLAFKFSSLACDGSFSGGEHKSAFSPYKPRTVLTNLQRGNVQTETVIVNPLNQSFHQKAGKGELTAVEIEKAKSNINDVDNNGLTALMWSSAYGQAPTTSLLLRAGALHSVKGPDGETALHLAAAGGHTEIIRLLISAGASINEVDDNWSTPLMFAAYGNHAHSVNELLNHSADITLTNLNDDSALSIAVKHNCKQAQSVIEGYLFMLLQPS